MLQPFAVAAETLDTYRRYVRSSFPLRDPQLDAQREELIEQRLLWAEPYVSLARPGTGGKRLADLKDVLCEDTLKLPWGFEELYQHQEQSIERLRATREGGPSNTLVLSGTGSGKTESFLIPVVDACLRKPGPGVRAVVIYPMNALANDQLKRLRGLLRHAPGVTFGRYTGDAPETDAGDSRRAARPADLPPNALWSRQAMRDTPPNILLTNYAQLELILLRGRDAELFRYGPPGYLIVDEIHMFAGILGAEVGCLLRRLRQHTNAGPTEICMVGTSATAGAEEQPRLLRFAERLFGSPFPADAAIAEAPAPLRPMGEVTPPPPSVAAADLAAAHEPSGLAKLAHDVLGIDVAAGETIGESLGRMVDTFRTIGVVERAFENPAPLSAAANALAALPEREGVALDALDREAMAILLLGSAAQQARVGEAEPQPRFRPRVHQVVRSLSGLWRCLNPACGRLVKPGQGRCGACSAAALPLASCRTCGEAYWTSPAPQTLNDLEALQTTAPTRSGSAVFLADPSRLTAVVDEDQDGNEYAWGDVVVCPACAGAATGAAGLKHARSCPNPSSQGVMFRGSIDNVHCPSCGDQGVRDRPILLPLQGSAAASVAVMTYALSDVLRAQEGEPGGRLLVFADSRQDAAHQAGYADDQGARIAVRQLLRAALDSGPLSLPDAIKAVAEAVTQDKSTLRRWLIGESDRQFAEISSPDYEPSSDDEKGIRQQITWEVVLDVTERSRRRFALEREGVVTVGVDRLDELVTSVAKTWPAHPFGSQERLCEVVLALVDVLRSLRAVDHWMLKLTPRSLIQTHHLRIGDRGITSSRGFAGKRHRDQGAQVDIRSWSAPKNATRITELLGRVLGESPTKVNEVAETLAARLHSAGLLTESPLEGRKRVMLDHRRLVLTRRDGEPLWRCDRCGHVRAHVLSGSDGQALCTNWRCPGRPRQFEPKTEGDFYRRQYLAEPRRLLVREHSGQIEGDERVALEERFNDREHPTVDVLACTPTLEVGVSLDDLNAVILRNLPPTPANYAQRVGRAGRRSKIALALAHASQAPHDSYFFERPGELITGRVRAPAISLENEPLLRRHVNSLVFETLGVELPEDWVPPIDATDDFAGETIADEDGVLRESALKPFADKLADAATRKRIDEAVRGAFASPHDPAPPANAARVCKEQVDDFLMDLRAALNRWCNRYTALLGELKKSRQAKGMPTKIDQEYEARLRQELQRLAQPQSPEFQPLGFLGLVGFLPRYGFTGETVLLHPPRGETPIGQSSVVAVTEYAPENVVYARGRKLKVRRLDPAPVSESEAGAEHRDNVLRQSRRCQDCAFLTFDPLLKACPTCKQDLISQQVIELTGVRGGGGAISSEDDYRSHYDYDVLHTLDDPVNPPQSVTLGGYAVEYSAGREIRIANRGLRRQGDEPAPGFRICLGCGFSAEAPAPGEDEDLDAELVGHTPRCPGRKDTTGAIVQRSVWLSAHIRGDVMEIVLPSAARGAGFADWRATLAEALTMGIRETMDAGPRDLRNFERQRAGSPWSLVIYDTMPGGTGYFPKLFENGALGLKRAAVEALRRLEACDCTRSCHRCLRDYWNQGVHNRLDRFQVMSTLRRLAEGEATVSLDPENDKLESFLEVEFFERLKKLGLPEPALQVVREIGKARIIRVDAEYRDPDISIYLDGRQYHALTAEKIEDDLDIRNKLEAKGICVLEFTFRDVMHAFPKVAKSIGCALKQDTGRAALDPASLPGFVLRTADAGTKRARLAINVASWQRDEKCRQESLSSCNALRLAGWRLRREPLEVPS